jgi:lipopolysaccharide export system permease protein
MTLHYYIARRFFWTFAAVFAIFFAFMTLLDLVEQLRKFNNVGFGEVLKLTLLNTPKSLYQILPLVTILSSIALFLGLARSSELVVIRAAGRSATTALLAPVTVALLMGGLAVGLFNPIVAATSKQYSQQRELYRNGGTSTLSIGSEGLWLRQGDEAGQTVIRAARTNPEATELFTVSFVSYAPGGGPVQRIEADQAVLENGEWVLSNAKVWPLGPDINAETAAQTFASYTVNSNLTQESIRDRFGTPSAISIWDLPAYITSLEIAGFSARRHLVWLQMELAKPVFLAAMVLVGAAFTMGHARMGKTGVGVLSAILLGFSLYYVRNFAQILGENGQVNAVLAAWAPPVASILLALGLILHREDG